MAWIPGARGWATLLPFGLLAGCQGEPEMAPDHSDFASADACSACHPLQAAEWRGSIMHYAAVSPVFNALELTMRELTEGAIAADGATPNFCSKCHTPIGDQRGELPSFEPGRLNFPAIDSLSTVASEGITCDFCHTVTGPDREGSLEQDGIANMALRFAPGATKRGPIADPANSPYHVAASIDYLRSSAFCGACHDVRLGHMDQLTGRAARLENLFSEWKSSRYASSSSGLGRPVECQDCHMSLFPLAPPGTFPKATIAEGGLPGRNHALHAFTAVSRPLIEDPRFPRVEGEGLDGFGFPQSQEARRQQMLRAACTLSLTGTPTTLASSSAQIPVRLTVTNVGAGHRVPAGFSEERQVWIHLVVEDDAGLLYESGHLQDRAHPETGELVPDGRLDDEDLLDREREIDPRTLEVSDRPGFDADRRPGEQLGLINFQNAFLAVGEDGELHEVVNPLQADTIDDRRSIPPLVGLPLQYDVPVSRPLVGALRLRATLRYRSFPPNLMRALAVRHPELVQEVHVDRNTIVDMAQAEARIELR